MNKKIIGSIIFSLFFSITLFSQITISKNNPDRDIIIKMYRYYQTSSEVKLPDSVYTILKKYATLKNLPQDVVLKHQYILKIIYNEAISKDERILICDKLIKDYNKINAALPTFLIVDMRNKLITGK